MSDKRVLILGIAGFVGPYLAREFAENGYTVFGSDIRDDYFCPSLSGYQKGDLTDLQSLVAVIGKFSPTHIINLAAISSVGFSWKNPSKTIEINVIGPLNLFHACEEFDIRPRILLIGSSEEYLPSSEPINEDWPIYANNPYGISKIAQEQFAQIFGSREDWKIYRVRAFNHIGVGQAETFVIPSWCKQVAEIEKTGQPGTIKVGNLSVVRDLSDVRDIVRAYRMIIESNFSNEVFNVGSGKGRALSDVLNTIISFSHQKINIEVNPSLLRPNDNQFIVCDHTRLKEKLGWRPSIEFKDTLYGIYQSFLK